MSKFILIVAIIYVVYYAVNILYDGFLKKTDVEDVHCVIHHVNDGHDKNKFAHFYQNL